jgi:hypothetical protein
MKRNRNPIAALAALAMAGSATAATTISYTYQTISDLSATSWVVPAGATPVTAVNFGSGGTTNWAGVAWTNGFTLPNNDGVIDVGFAGAIRYDGYHSNTGGASQMLWEGSYSGTSNPLVLDGFSVGQEYLVQFVLADTRGGGVEGRTITIDGTSANIASQDSSAYTFAYSSGNFAVVTARFVANESSFSFAPLVNGGDAGVQINALNILTIPEPSAALLGGLGFLALLRRRR